MDRNREEKEVRKRARRYELVERIVNRAMEQILRSDHEWELDEIDAKLRERLCKIVKGTRYPE